MIGGPIVSWLIGALETAALVGGVSALGGALITAGIPADSVVKYEAALKVDKFLVIAHGAKNDVEEAKTILKTNDAESVEIHSELRQLNAAVAAAGKSAAKVSASN